MPDLSNNQLKLGYWYFLHRDFLRHTGYAVAFGMVTIIWAFAGWKFVDWYSSRQAEEESLKLLVSSSVNIEEYRQRNAPVPPELGVVTAVPTSDGKYDLVAQIKNPNLKWGITELPYTFKVDGQEVNGVGFLLPLDDKYVVSLGVELSSQPRQVSLIIGDIKWQRIRDFKTFTSPSFEVTEENFDKVSSSTGLTGRLRFNLNNTSPYNFYEVGVTVVLTTAGSIQAVGKQVITDVKSNAPRQVEFFWPGNLPSVDHMIVKPEVNVLNSNVLKKL